MADVGDAYLPDLTRCLAGAAVVFSWQVVLSALTRRFKTDSCYHIINDLAESSYAKTILAQPAPTFLLPSQQSRTRYETRTAAISIAPSNDKAYDIERIKADVRWLSEEVNLAEEDALRIVLLEWQQQPIEILRSGYSDTEIASLQGALGGAADVAELQTTRTFKRRQDDDFEVESVRRCRLLRLFFKELVAMLEVAVKLREVDILAQDRSDGLDSVQRLAHNSRPKASIQDALSGIIKEIEKRLGTLSAGRSWPAELDGIEDYWQVSEMRSVQCFQELLLLTIRRTDESAPADTVLYWIRVMIASDFLANIEPGSLFNASEVEQLQATSATLTTAFLDPATALATIANTNVAANQQPYFLLPDAASEVHSMLMTATDSLPASVSPIILAWGLVLSQIHHSAIVAKEARESGTVQKAIDQVAVHDSATNRRASGGSLQQSVFEDVMDAIMTTSDVTSPAGYLLRWAVEVGNIFDTVATCVRLSQACPSLLGALRLQVLQELTSAALSQFGYVPEILAVEFLILSPFDEPLDPDIPDARDTFIENEFLMDSLFAVAAGRFPYESVPFLRLCRLLAKADIFNEQGMHYIAFRLDSLKSYTQVATGAFAAYHTTREDENLNLVALTHSLDIFQGVQTKLVTYGQDSDTAFVIQANTIGEVVSDSNPPIIKWNHSDSGLALLGRWIELHYLGRLQGLLSPQESAVEVVSEIIGLFDNLLIMTPAVDPDSSSEARNDHTQIDVLQEASTLLSSDNDIVVYVFELLNQELQVFRRRPSNTFNTSLLIACIRLISSISSHRPAQFWSLISRSGLLDAYGADSFLMSIVSAVEVPNRSFEFLESCAGLLHCMLDSAALHNDKSAPSSFKSGPRNAHSHSIRLRAEVILKLSQSLYRVFEVMPAWSFTSLRQQFRIVDMLCGTFETIISHSYSAGQESTTFRLAFVPSADFIVAQLRNVSQETLATPSIIQHLAWLQEMDDINIDVANEIHMTALSSLLLLSNTVVRLGMIKLMPPSALEHQLLGMSPVLCRHVAMSQSTESIDLLQTLLDVLATSETVSLLGHLGAHSAIQVLEALKLAQARNDDDGLSGSIWKLLARLVRRNQQWLAIVILTGSPPDRHRTAGQQSKGMKKTRGLTFIDIALEELSAISKVSPQLAVAVLSFTIEAQQNWSWVSDTMKTNTDFFATILSYVCNSYTDTSDSLKLSVRNQIAALVTDLTTIHLYHTKGLRDSTTLKVIVPLFKWLAENAVDVATYNDSLHANLERNFTAKFGGLGVNDFRRTGLFEATYGSAYYYDIQLASMIVGGEPCWDGKDKYRDQSFSSEFRRANLNLSVVESEVKLLHSFLGLCIEHSGFLVQDREIQQVMVLIVRNCLEANTRSDPSAQLFDSLLQTRADLATSLLQRLVDGKVRGTEARSILVAAWESVKARHEGFEHALIAHDLDLWHTNLTIVLMALQFHTDRRYMPPAADHSPAALLRHSESSISTMLEIATVVVGQGLKTVVIAVQEQSQSNRNTDRLSSESISGKDFALILAILKTILRMTRLPEFITELSQRLISEGALQSCLVLYSWVHVLTESEGSGEPVYAVYSLQLLTCMSSLPLVAEEMAVEGALSRLLSARITQKLQNLMNGAGHTDKRPHAQMLFGLWAANLLPICLNLLHAVGPPLAAEVSVFLNQFPQQLSRASTAFILSTQVKTGSADLLTLPVAKEAANLALISHILNSYRAAGASAAVDPSTIRNLVGYDEDKKALAEDISDVVAMGIVDLKARVIPSSQVETALLREDDGTGLVRKVVAELQRALICLKGDAEEDEK